jgi:hypothetical protein
MTPFPTDDILDSIPAMKSQAFESDDILDSIPAAKPVRSAAPAAPKPADPLNATMSARRPGFIEQITAPIRDSSIGRAFGVDTRTDEWRKEQGNALVNFENALPNQDPGVVRGVAKFASGLTTPENALLMAGTGGLGALAKQIGRTGVSKLISMGFSADMLTKALEQAPQFAEQAKAGDWDGARETLTSIGLGAGMAALGLKHGMAADVKPVEATKTQIRDAQRPYVEPPPPGPPGPKMNREQRRATAAPPEIGTPEPVERAQAEREAIIGKPREQWTNEDVIAADELRVQGFTGASNWKVSPEAFLSGGKTSAKPTVPETPDTLKLQVGQLAAGDRRAVMFPRGTPLVKRPAGVKYYQDADGNTYFYNPKLTDQRSIDAAISENRLPALLGATEGGMGAPDKTALAGEPVAVVGRTREGVTTQATAADQASLPEALRQTEKLTPPEGQVAVEPPEIEIARRTEQAPPPTRTEVVQPKTSAVTPGTGPWEVVESKPLAEAPPAESSKQRTGELPSGTARNQEVFKNEPVPDAAWEIADRLKEKRENPLPWSRMVDEHSNAAQRFVDLLNSKNPDKAELAAAAVKLDRIAEPMKHELRNTRLEDSLTAREVATEHGKTVTGNRLRPEKPTDYDAIREANTREFMEHRKRFLAESTDSPAEPVAPKPTETVNGLSAPGPIEERIAPAPVAKAADLSAPEPVDAPKVIAPQKPVLVEKIKADNPDVGEYTINQWPNGKYQVKHWSRRENASFGSNFDSLEAARDAVAKWNENHRGYAKADEQARVSRMQGEAARLRAENERLKAAKAPKPSVPLSAPEPLAAPQVPEVRPSANGRTTPPTGTPERIKLEADYKAASDAQSEFWDKQRAVETEARNAKWGSKKKEAAEKKLEKLREIESQHSAIVEPLRKQAYMARLEDYATQTENPVLRIAGAQKLAEVAEDARRKSDNRPTGKAHYDAFLKQREDALESIRQSLAAKVESVDKHSQAKYDSTTKEIAALSPEENEAAIDAAVKDLAQQFIESPSYAEDVDQRLAGRLHGQRVSAYKAKAKEFVAAEKKRFDDAGVSGWSDIERTTGGIDGAYEIDGVDRTVNAVRESVDRAIANQQIVDANNAESRRTFSKSVRPLSEMPSPAMNEKVGAKKVWEGNVVNGDTYLSDGSTIISAESIRDKKRLASMKNGERKFPEDKVRSSYWDEIATKPTEPVGELGMVNSSDIDVALYVAKDGAEILPLSAKRVRFIQSVTGATEVRRSSFKGMGVFYRDGKPVAALMPFGKAPDIDLAVARETLGITSPKAKPFGSERGSFSLKPVNQPTTPGEIYAKEMIAAREAAREGPISALATRVKRAIAKAKAEAVDSTAPILDALKQSQKKHGYEVRPSANIEYNIDRALRATSIAEQFVKDQGFDKIIKNVEDVDYLDQYLIAKHAMQVERLKNAGKPAQQSVTGRDLARDAQLVAEFRNRQAMPGKTYDQVAKEVSAYSNKVLDYSVESGLVSKDLATALKQMYPDYVPLNRVFSAVEQGAFQGPSARAVASLSKQTIVQKLEGSSREIENPLWSMLDKTRKAFEQGERNKAAKQLAGYRNLPGFEGLIQEVAEGQGAPQNTTFTFLDGGQKRTFQTTPEIAAAARSLDVHSIGLLGRIFAAPGRLMKLGTTGINLPFVLSNVAADQLHTLVTSRYERSLANPGVFFKAMMAAVKHDGLWSEVVRQGAGFTSFDQYRGQPKSTVRSIRGSRDVSGAKDTLRYITIDKPAQLFRQVEDIVSRSEEFGRARLYAQAKDALMKKGRTEADAKILATLEANNALPNYMRAGSVMRPLNAIIPYLNAGVQGSRSFLRSMERNPVKTAASVATTLYFPVAMATLWNLSDPERKKAYADIQDYEKDGNIVILLPGKPSRDNQNRYDVLKFKLPPGLNQLTIPLRRAIEAASGLDPVKFSEVAHATIGSVSPIEPNVRSIGSTLVPQALKPTVQAVANYDFFRGQPKVPGRLQDLPPELQTTSYTSGTAKKIAGAFGVSPIKTEGFIKDTLGGVGSQVLNASDRALYRAGKIPASDIGGTSTVEAVGARFSKARGGELDNKEFELKKSIELDTERRAVAEARKTPYFMRLSGNEEMANRYLASVAARARNQVQQLTLSPRYRKMEADQKIAELQKLKARLAGGAPPTRLYRPIPTPIVPPSRRSRYDLSAPGPIQ